MRFWRPDSAVLAAPLALLCGCSPGSAVVNDGTASAPPKPLSAVATSPAPSPPAPPAPPLPPGGPCGFSPSDWCPAPPGDPCGAHRDAASCKADARCKGMPYRGESVVACHADARGFPDNCPAVGCISR